MADDKVHHLVLNPENGLVGCALLQAAMGGDSGIANRFPVETWTTNPIGLRLYIFSDEQLTKIADIMSTKHKIKRELFNIKCRELLEP